MRRALLKLGDKSSNGGVVTEGIDSCTHHGTPITFIGAKVWCSECKSEGVIGWKGPHRNSTMMGKQQALDGDICICNCSPPPVFRASQDSAWHVFETHELAAMGYDQYGESLPKQPTGDYDEQFTLTDAGGNPLADTYYTARMPSGELRHGVTDSQGCTKRYETDGACSVRIYLGHKQEA